jgi:hypothetical protein
LTLLDGMIDTVFSEIELPAGREQVDDHAAAGDLDPHRHDPTPLGHRADGVRRMPGLATLRTTAPSSTE